MSDSDNAPEAHVTTIDGSTAQPMTRSRQRAQAADAGSEHGGDRRAAEEENDDLARARRRNEQLEAEVKQLLTFINTLKGEIAELQQKVDPPAHTPTTPVTEGRGVVRSRDDQ